MNVTNWTEYLKHDGSDLNTTNVVYAPLVNPEGTVLCMDFVNPRITIENDFYFERELYYLDKFKDFSWAPEENPNLTVGDRKGDP